MFMIAGFALASRFSLTTTLWRARVAIMLLGFGMGLVNPLVMLGVQQAFGRRQRAVVTSAVSFFRSVGSTVGVTVLGALFNARMAAQFESVMAPQLGRLPGSVSGRLSELAARPSDLVQVLLQKPLQQLLPLPVRATVLALIRSMMAAAIRPVFLTSMGIMVLGVVVAQSLGNESLKRQMARQAAVRRPVDDGDAQADDDEGEGDEFGGLGDEAVGPAQGESERSGPQGTDQQEPAPALQ